MYRKLSTFIAFIVISLFLVFPAYAQEVVTMEITIEVNEGQRAGTYTGTYTGTVENGLPNGTGRFETQTSEGEAWYYEGGFADGLFNGDGKKVWDNGQHDEGVYLNGELYNGKIWLGDGTLSREVINGARVLPASVILPIIGGIGLFFVLVIIVVLVIRKANKMREDHRVL